jgi:hypothetical protein
MKLRFGSLLLFLSFLLAACSSLQLPAGLISTPSSTPAAAPTAVPAQSSEIPSDSSPVIPSTPSPTPEPYPFLWVTNTYDHTVLGVDPMTNAARITLKLEGKPEGIASGMGALWVVEHRQDLPDRLLRINPDKGELSGEIQMQPGNVVAISTGAGGVWVGMNPQSEPDKNTDDHPGTILRIDSTAITVSETLPMEGQVLQITALPDAVWVLLRVGAFTRLVHIDAATLKTTSLPTSVPTLEYAHEFSRFAIDNSALWTLSTNGSARFIYRVNPANGQITNEIALGKDPTDTPVDLISASQRLWVLLRSGKVVLIDPQTMQITNQIDTHSEVSELLQTAGSVWGLNRAQAILYRLELGGSANALVSTGRKMPPTPVPMPTLLPGQKVCEGDYPSYLKSGIRAMVKPVPPIPNRVRTEPNKNSRLLGEIHPGEEADILEGPICTDGWVWWKVSAHDGELIGWTAEGDGNDYWLVPVP